MKLRDKLAEKVQTINESMYELYSREVLKWCDQFMPKKLEKLFVGSDGTVKMHLELLDAEIDGAVKSKVFRAVCANSNLTTDNFDAYFSSKERPKASNIVVSWLVEEGFNIDISAFYLHIKM